MSRRARFFRPRDQRGTMLVEFTWLAILLLIPLVYIMISVFEVQRGAFAVTAAARSAGRAYAIAPTMEAGQARAGAAARVALRDQGLPAEDYTLQVACAPDPSACLAPGSTISVTVTSQVALPLVPSVLGGGTPTFRVEATHAAPRGRYRSN